MVYDLVTPAPVEGQSGQALLHQRRAPHQPQDFREGVANAYDVVTSVSTLKDVSRNTNKSVDVIQCEGGLRIL